MNYWRHWHVAPALLLTSEVAVKCAAAVALESITPLGGLNACGVTYLALWSA